MIIIGIIIVLVMTIVYLFVMLNAYKIKLKESVKLCEKSTDLGLDFFNEKMYLEKELKEKIKGLEQLLELLGYTYKDNPHHKYVLIKQK